MKTLLNYNFNLEDIVDKDFARLYESRRRDSVFAVVFEDAEGVYALRDHIGICPLWYMEVDGELLFATNVQDLPHGSSCTDVGLRSYVALWTTKVSSLFDDVHLVPPGGYCFSIKKPNRQKYCINISYN